MICQVTSIKYICRHFQFTLYLLANKVSIFEHTGFDLFETFLVCHSRKHVNTIRTQIVFVSNSDYMKKTITCLINRVFCSTCFRPIYFLNLTSIEMKLYFATFNLFLQYLLISKFLAYWYSSFLLIFLLLFSLFLLDIFTFLFIIYSF